MKTAIVQQPPSGFENTPCLKEQRRRLREALDAKYAEAWARPGFFRRLWLRFRKRRELERELEYRQNPRLP
jgi:hypothetical protein